MRAIHAYQQQRTTLRDANVPPHLIHPRSTCPVTTTRILTAAILCPLLAITIVFAPAWLLTLLIAVVAALCTF